MEQNSIMEQIVNFPSKQVKYVFETRATEFLRQFESSDIVFITDSNVALFHGEHFKNKKHIILPAGESSKSLQTIERVASELIKLNTTRKSLLIGVGGGVVTDITGLVASMYMRGITFGFIPTTLLGMVDAAIGGKNGVNLGLHKNVLGTFLQPDFLLFDTDFLNSLPQVEWANGFAEVIKYACIFDSELFDELAYHNRSDYQQNSALLGLLISRCVAWKNQTVIEDERESGIRKLLNFGHTSAHAIENLYNIPHGQAVAIGMVIAATLSENVAGLTSDATVHLKKTLQQYDLPVSYPFDVPKAMELLKMDKKRNNNEIDFIILNQIGHASVQPLPFSIIEKTLMLCAQ